MYKLLIFSIDKVIHIKWLLLDLHVLCPSSANIPACLASLGLMQRTYDGSFDIRISINFARLVLNWVAVCRQQQHTSNEGNKTQKGRVSQKDTERGRKESDWGRTQIPVCRSDQALTVLCWWWWWGGVGEQRERLVVNNAHKQSTRAGHPRPANGLWHSGSRGGGGGWGQRGNSEQSVEGTQESGHSLGRGPAGPGQRFPEHHRIWCHAQRRGYGPAKLAGRLFENKRAVNVEEKKKRKAKQSWFSPSLAAFCRSAPPCRSTRWGSCYLTGT